MQSADEQRKSILVVEDEGLIADDIRRRLERFGYAVPAIASSGEEALSLSRSQPFDLVLMDIRLKGEMDGITVAQQLRRDLQAPVVYLTAHADPDTVSRATVTEPFGYILKPISDSNLRSTVQIALYKHEMERRLRISEAWLSTTLRSIGDGIIATDSNGEIVFLNAAAGLLTGSSAATAQGQPLMDVLALRDDRSGERSGNPVFDLLPGEARAYKLLSRTGETYPVEVECFENRDQREMLGAIVALRDIRRRTECEARLVQNQRMDAIAALASGVAGDLDTVVAQLQARVDELDVYLPEEVRERAGQIRQSASCVAAFAAQLSALSRRDALRPEVINVNQEILEARTSLELSLGDEIRLEACLAPQTGFIAVNRDRFLQVLFNLSRYARQQMTGGGAFRLETSILDLQAADPLARRSRSPWLVRLSLSVAGLHTDSSALPFIFEPRFAEAPSAGRSRFSLAIVHAIVTQSEGLIQVSNGPGEGTVFEILWPCLATHQSVSGLVGRGLDHPVSTVLVIEEEDALRRDMSTALREDGYSVIETKTARDAELSAAALGAPISLLIAESAAAPLAAQLNIPATLYLSGYRHDSVPPDGVLQKPFPLAEFRRRVRLLAA